MHYLSRHEACSDFSPGAGLLRVGNAAVESGDRWRANSNHLAGCAADIRVTGFEQVIRYAAILLDYADESHQEFDELLVERNRYGAIWLHFAVRFRENRHKVLYINA